MSTLTTRAGKGSPLTNNELDANFTNLNADKVEVGGDLSGTSSAPNVAKIQGRAVSTDAPAAGEKLVWSGTAWEPSVDPTGEPIGHADKTQSTISFNSGTRTFTIAPVASEFVVWCKGVKYTYTSAQTVVIPNTTGLHYIYFSSSGVLSTQMSFFSWEEHAPTAYVYWNATTSTAVYFGDERHGITLDWQTHEYLHRTRGAAIANGFGASNYTTTGTGATDADAQIDIAGGTFFDEDMQVDIVSTNSPVANTWQQDLSGPARIPVMYLSGSAWVIDSPTDFPFKSVAGVPQYNLYSGGVWSTANVANNEYHVSWILATNNLNYPVISIISQAATNQVSQAEAMTFEGLSLSGFPSVEFRPLYKIIYQHRTSFTNSVKVSTIAVYDLRSLQSAGVAAALVQDHGNLSGLGDDDHAQYLHVSEVRSTTQAVKNSFLPSQTSNNGKYLTTDGTNPSWGSIPSGSLTFTGDVTGSGTTGSSTALTLANSGVTTGTYSKVTVDAKGRVTSGANIASSDVTTALGFTPENVANKAVANGYASLDSSGKVPSNQLPSYVDDVLEYANLAAFPGTGETGKIYIAIDSAKVYRWSGSAYIEITSSPGSTDSVAEGSTNLYFTNARARAALSGSSPISYSSVSGLISHAASGVTAGTYGSATAVPVVTVNAEGHITGVSTSAISGSITFTGDVTGAGTTGSTTTLTLANSGVTAGTYTKVTVDAKGRVTTGASLASGDLPTYTGTLTSGQVTTALGYTPPQPTGTGASGTWGINISGGIITSAASGTGVNFAYATVGSDDFARIRAGSDSYNTGWLELATADDGTEPIYVRQYTGVFTSVARTLTLLDGSGQTIIPVNVQAPIYYDSADTAYYVDPASTSVLSKLTLNGKQASLNVGAPQTSGTSTTAIERIYAGYGVYGEVLDVGFNVGTSYAWLQPTNYTNLAINYALLLNPNGGNVGIGLSNATPAAKLQVVQSTPSGIGGVPSGVTMISDSSSNNYLLFRNTADNGTYSGIAFQDNNIGGYVIFGNAGASPSDQMAIAGYGGGILQYGSADSISPGARTTVASWNSTGLQINNGDMRAPIYYDSNDTAYYDNPASISRFNGVNLNTLYVKDFLNWNASSSSQVGYPTIAYNILGAGGNAIYPDEEFLNGFNGLNIYNNLGGSALTYARVSDSTAPNKTGWIIRYTYNGGGAGTTPGYGGFYFGVQTAANKVLVCRWRAKMASGRTFNFASNPTGSNGTSYWLTSNSGTGRWEDYAYVVICGDSGSFSSTHFFYVDGSVSVGTLFDIAAATVLDITDNTNFNKDYLVAQNDSRAPIFYDLNNTGYYVDPASTSNLNATNWVGSFSYTGSAGSQALNLADNDGYASMRVIRNNKSGSDGMYIGYINTNGGVTRIFGGGSSGGELVKYATYTEEPNSFRAPIFYDSNNTGYYVDPNSNSVLYKFENINQRTAYDRGWSNYPSITVYNTTDQGPQGDFRIHGAAGANGGDFSVRLLVDGTIESLADVRAPIFYDSNNTGYYLDPTSSFNFVAGSGTFYSGGSGVYVSNPEGTGQTLRMGAAWSKPGIYCAGDITVGSESTVNFWTQGTQRGYFDSSSNFFANGSSRAPIFYDLNDTGYYTDQAGTSNYNNLIINGTLRLPNNALVNVNNEPDVWGARFRTTTSTTYLGASLQNIIWCGGGAYEGFTTQGSGTGGAAFTARNDGICWARSSFRSPIFYDQDNTGYYFDGAGLSRFNQGDCVGRWYFYANRNTSSDSPPLQAYSDNGSGAIMSFHRGGYYAVNMGLDSDNVFRIGGWSAAVNRLQLDMSGNLYSASSMRSSVFYDQDDTGYYLDPNSTSASCLRVAGGIHVSVGNVTGQGIILADDGDIVDLNDGYCAMRFSYGVRIHSGNRTGGAVIALTNGGNIIANGNVTAYGSASDIRLKENIVPISNALSKVNSLTGYSFNYKGKHDRLIGVIAQETEKVLPEVVYDYENQETGEINKAVRYENMVALLIEAVKELKAELDSVKSRLH